MWKNEHWGWGETKEKLLLTSSNCFLRYVWSLIYSQNREKQYYIIITRRLICGLIKEEGTVPVKIRVISIIALKVVSL